MRITRKPCPQLPRRASEASVAPVLPAHQEVLSREALPCFEVGVVLASEVTRGACIPQDDDVAPSLRVRVGQSGVRRESAVKAERAGRQLVHDWGCRRHLVRVYRVGEAAR